MWEIIVPESSPNILQELTLLYQIVTRKPLRFWL